MLLKALLYLGTVLLLGAGLFPRFIGPGLQGGAMGRRLWLGLGLGAALVAAVSLADIPLTLERVLGRSGLALSLDYLQNTRHGAATLWRVGLVAALVLLGPRSRLPKLLDRSLYVALGLGLLTTVSTLSHAAAMGIPFAVVTDLAHQTAAALWTGAVLYLAWLPLWGPEQRGGLGPAVERVSQAGLLSVLVLTASGIYAATLHLGAVDELITTAYGRALVYKNIAVAVILALAAANRWILLPAFRRQGPSRRLRRSLRLESLLLAAVLGLTGLLSTRQPSMHQQHIARLEAVTVKH